MRAAMIRHAMTPMAATELVSATAIDQAKVDDAVAQLRRLRKGTTLGGLSWRELRDEGRK